MVEYRGSQLIPPPPPPKKNNLQNDRIQEMEIFTCLKQGSVHNLIKEGKFENYSLLSDFFGQLPSVLSHLNSANVIHRDVKPANILYTFLPNGHCEFQLADFGLSNTIYDAWSLVGMEQFIAPELLLPWSNKQVQTHKMDLSIAPCDDLSNRLTKQGLLSLCQILISPSTTTPASHYSL